MTAHSHTTGNGALTVRNVVDVTPDMLLSVLEYDNETGLLYWKHRSVDLFSGKKRSASTMCKSWNGKNAGNQAFTSKTTGYYAGSVFDKPFLAHRVIWAMHAEKWPDAQIDHINGDRSDNRLLNLREVSSLDNCRNRCVNKNNTSGATGVAWAKWCSKWRVKVGVDGADVHIGYFSSYDEAVAARTAAQIDHGFHPNHGRAA